MKIPGQPFPADLSWWRFKSEAKVLGQNSAERKRPLGQSKKLSNEVNNMEMKLNRADRRKAKKSGPEKQTPAIAQQSGFHPTAAKSVALPPTRNNRAGSRKP
jgi:hypothetical protein